MPPKEDTKLILDHLDNWKRYAALNPAFAEAFAFLESPKATSLPAGRHSVSDDIYVNVVRGPGSGREKGKFEAHRQYIDIQYTFEGTDELGWKPTAQCTTDGKGYDDENDAELFSDTPETWVLTPPGFFAIFFPEDGHAPLCGTGQLGKAVVKVPVV